MSTSQSSKVSVKDKSALTFQLSQAPSPAGTFYFIADGATMIAGGFASHKALMHYLSEEQQKAKFVTVKNIKGISEYLSAYNKGEIKAINKIKTSQNGGDFYQNVWKEMRKIPAGKVDTYAELAMSAGNGKAVRAAGSACARNAIALVVPCHRVVKTGGALGNYAYGVQYKQILLEHEGYLEK